MKKQNREELRALMTEYRLQPSHVADLIYSSAATIRIYISKTGADISDANLELLKFKIGDLKNAIIRS